MVATARPSSENMPDIFVIQSTFPTQSIELVSMAISSTNRTFSAAETEQPEFGSIRWSSKWRTPMTI
jgi:hypothetical protein